ncbi:MAG: 3-deoxy-D-manno-octulosonic acid transferase [Pseudomonadota bacterium]
MSAAMLALYSASMRAAQPLLRRKLARRALDEPGYAEAVEERFGHYRQPAELVSELVWVHAVSLGETRTAAILLRAWRQAHPGLRVLLTHGTATGRAEGKALLMPGDVQVWQPWDAPPCVARFLAHFKPRLGVLMETEIWPAMMSAAQSHGIPVALVNARLSGKSLAQAQRMVWLARPAFSALTAAMAQTREDADRLRLLGTKVTGVFGNLKFDAQPDAGQQVRGRAWQQALDRPVVMLASSREGEEAQFVRDVMQAKAAHAAQPFTPLIVPRHPQRFEAVQRLLEQQGLEVSRRSAWPLEGPIQHAGAAQADVWLGDTMGEMALYYSLSRVALLGGSFEPLGGQNLIEPAACGCPVVMGPHTFNFTEAARLARAEGAAFEVPGMSAAGLKLQQLLGEPVLLQAASAAGQAFAQRHSGATSRTVGALQALLAEG